MPKMYILGINVAKMDEMKGLPELDCFSSILSVCDVVFCRKHLRRRHHSNTSTNILLTGPDYYQKTTPGQMISANAKLRGLGTAFSTKNIRQNNSKMPNEIKIIPCVTPIKTM